MLWPNDELQVHPTEACEGEWCVLHNPSDHRMKDWPRDVRLDKWGVVERICPHGIGHSDPDSVAFFVRKGGANWGWVAVHGCDGCCRGEK